MWAIYLLTNLLLFPLLSAAPLDIAGGVKDDTDGMHSHDENVTRGGKFFAHNQFDVGNINVPGSVVGDNVSIGHQLKIDIQGHTHDRQHHEADTDSCSGTESDGDCCSSTSPCQENEGDCDTDDDCVGSLVCGKDNCRSINPLAYHLADCCIQPASCSGTESDWDCCSSTSPCKENEGDCDTDDDCVGSLVCGKDNCRNINPLAYPLADCCIQPGIFVEGGWSAWSSWSACTGICGETKTRTRACSSPPCTGAITETVGCDLLSCSTGMLSPVEPVCYAETGNFRDRYDCSVFYMCSDGVTTKFECGHNLVFNQKTFNNGHCDHDWNVNCDEYPDPQPPTPDNPSDPQPPTPDNPSDPQPPTLKEAEAMEEELTSSEMMKMVKHSIRTLDSNLVAKIAPGVSENPENVKRVEAILKESDFEYLFPQRDAQYTYHNFLKAIGKFPAICDTYKERDSDLICKKTLATMFAHFTQETGGHNPDPDVEEWRQGLVWLREMPCREASAGCPFYGLCAPCWQSEAWPCGKNPDGTWKNYFGRGAKQLSYNYNYGPFSYAIFGTVRTLLDEPSLVADTWLNFASAMWFYVYPQPPKPSMLFVIDGTWQPNENDTKNGLEAGFGATIEIINGGIECTGRLDGAEMKQARNRINYYKKFSEYFKVNIEGEQLSCAHMAADAFTSDGSGALPIYWEEDWSHPTNYQCQLVSYQTPYTALKKGDYVECVKDKFDHIP